MRYRLKRYRGVWNVVWFDGRTRRASLGTPDLAEAERRFAEWKRQLNRIGPTVGDIMDAYLAEKENRVSSYATMKFAWQAAKPTFGPLMPDQINRDKCREYIAKRRSMARKDGTIIREINTVRAGIRWGAPGAPAVFELPHLPPPRSRHLSREEYGRLRDAASAPHVRLFIILAIATAGRASAILGLTWDRVDLKRGLIALQDAPGRRKGRATVPMTDSARIALTEAQRAARSDFVIEYADKQVKSVKRGFREAVRKAGLTDVSPHVLRHSAAVWMAEAGVSMPEIAAYLGHSDSRLTERVYAKFSPDFLRKAAKALEI